MTEQQILERAGSYVALEGNDLFRTQVEELLKNPDSAREELRDRFYMDLDFGTAGLRGVIGGGFNRMNSYNVKRATQGLANYILKNVPEGSRSAVVSFDSRHFSDVFAMEASLVLAANGIRTSLFKSLRPVPELSFAVRHLKASAGIMITASHNPAEYNGYKVFWADGGQITPPHDKGIIREVNAVSSDIKTISREKALEKKLLVMIDETVDAPYCAMAGKLLLRPGLMAKEGKRLKIVYTPLHGAGTIPVERILSENGCAFFTVPEQRSPDGDFPTVAFPNPEMAPAMDLALKYAAERGADLVLGTDPDADRLGIAVPSAEGWKLVSGNQLGALLCDYIFSSLKEMGKMPSNPAFINTIVTTDLQNEIAESYGATSFKVLTGFKYIGEKIRQFETDGSYHYIFGGEESYGFLAGTDVRDKDAVTATLLTVELALWNITRGRTVLDHLNDIYTRFGFYDELLISSYFKGEKGLQIMKDLMGGLRTSPPAEFGGIKVSLIKDYLDGTVRETETGKKNKSLDLPPTDALQFYLEDGSCITARPSGTEPKIKFYASCRSEKGMPLAEARKVVAGKLKKIEADIGAMLPE
jgi:phosphoglucomutase